MRLNAAASSCVRSALRGPARSATWLGVTPAALYLRTSGTPGVLALLTHDAVRLPCALVLPATTAELPLTSVADPGASALAGDAMVGGNSLAWTGPAGPVVVHVVREWAPARVTPRPVQGEVLAILRGRLPDPAALGIDDALLTMLTTEPAAAVTGLLGRGPGLTPAGDDVLAAFLVGARAFGLDAGAVRRAVAALAAVRTTDLSAALLWHAARGECIDEVAAVVAALCRQEAPAAHYRYISPALAGLLRVGHTSGPAMACGLAVAAEAALRVGAGPAGGTGVEAA